MRRTVTSASNSPKRSWPSFDLLTKPEPVLSEGDEAKVKEVARGLLATLKTELLVLDWKTRQANRAAVQVAIEECLDENLPPIYDRALFSRKSAAVWDHVFSAYEGGGKSIYERVA